MAAEDSIGGPIPSFLPAAFLLSVAVTETLPRLCCSLLLLGLLAAGQARAELRLQVEGGEAFSLSGAAGEDSTLWYDAEAWLRRLPGEVSWDAADGRLVYRDGAHWSALKAEPPFAVRDGRPLEVPEPPRLQGGRLLVTEAFLRLAGARFAGVPMRVVAERSGPARRVVLDPAHGGGDPGTRGPGEVVEKDVVLKLAGQVADALRRRGFEVHLTRQGDAAIDAAQRAAVANYWAADLFLSLHVAGAGRPQMRGYEILVSPAPPPGADPRRWEFAQADAAPASRRWAAALRASLGERLATFDRGVGESPNPVLEGVAAPACAVEVGNLAWPGDLESLLSATGGVALAEAVAAAAQTFFDDEASAATPQASERTP